jgi:hypothetical protein
VKKNSQSLHSRHRLVGVVHQEGVSVQTKFKFALYLYLVVSSLANLMYWARASHWLTPATQNMARKSQRHGRIPSQHREAVPTRYECLVWKYRKSWDTLVLGPGIPLGLGLELHSPWCSGGVVTSGGLLEQTVQHQELQ